MKFKLLFLFLIIFIVSCSNREYVNAKERFKQKKYASAIELYDLFLYNKDKSALSVKAKLERSECYLQLGLFAMENENLILAIRFFFLANSKKADSYADDCYWQLAKNSYDENDMEQTLEYLDFVKNNFPESNFLNNLLLKKIKILYEEYNDKEKSFQTYLDLVNSNPSKEEIAEANNYINNFFGELIEDAVAMEENISVEASIDRLLILHKLPTKYKGEIKKIIAENYFKLGEKAIRNKQYIKADDFFRLAVEYDKNIKNRVQKRLIDVSDKFVIKGKEMLKERKIDDAINLFNKAKEIIPNYSLAIEAVKYAETLKEKIKLAEIEAEKAYDYEKQKKYKNALNYYKKANKIDNNERYRDKIFLMKNMIEIEKNPKLFAKNIIREYKNGSVVKKIDSLEKSLKKRFSEEEIISSGWVVRSSIGEDKYDVRYDIISPEKNYYFVWQIVLRNRKVIPLNKITEQFFK